MTQIEARVNAAQHLVTPGDARVGDDQAFGGGPPSCGVLGDAAVERAPSDATAKSIAVPSSATLSPTANGGPSPDATTRDETAPPSQSITVEIGVGGMTCASCSARLERSLRKRQGVLSAEVQLLQERARITVVPGTTVESLFEAIDATGFTARALPKQQTAAVFADEEAAFARAARRDGLLLLVSIALSFPLVIPMLLMPFGLHWHLNGIVQLALATPVQFLLGARFYRAGTKALLRGSGNMDLLVALGTSAAYFYSAHSVLRDAAGAGASLYFEASAVVITLVRLGKWLESRAKRGTTVALRELLRLRPAQVTIRRRTGQAQSEPVSEDVEIPAEQLEPGMLMLVRPGNRFAADGIVIEGKAAVDESMITGEPLPVQRGPGESVVSGSLNLNGLVVAQVTRVGGDATLGQIIKMVQGAQAGKAKVQQLVDRISAWFVPAVLAIAALTFLAWWIGLRDFEGAMVAAVSVLVIACPCALGLATPTAIVAGTGAAARAGILVRDVDTLQRASRVDSVVFDKTGTLTQGRPQVVSTQTDAGSNFNEMLRLAASVEQASTHPLSLAIVQHAKQLGLILSAPVDFEEHAGDGISATVDGNRIRVGQLAWLGQCGVQTSGSEAFANAPSDAREVVAKTPSDAREVVAKTPSDAREVVANAPSDAREVVAKTPSDAREVVAKTPSDAREVVAKTPSDAREVVAKTPSDAREVVAKTPSDAREVVAKTPSDAREVVAKTPSDAREGVVKPSSDARALVGVARDNELLGTLAIADTIRDTAADAVRALTERGIRTVLLSGDDERVVAQLAANLHITQIFGRARPEHKQQIIAGLRTEGRCVAMVGDGINDAPALATADVGIAIGGGTDVAMQTANVVIMRADLRLIAATLEVAKATFDKIRQNLFWAFIYNCVGIPLAATGRLTPMIAGLAMAMSSVSVVTNSLLLRRWRPN